VHATPGGVQLQGRRLGALGPQPVDHPLQLVVSVVVKRHRTHIRATGPIPDRGIRDDDFARLYDEEAPGLFSFLAYRTGDRALAQDLLADAFEKALRGRARYDRRRASERTWLYSIALNVLRDHARRDAALARASARLVPVREAQPDGRLQAVEDRDALARALATLSDEEREAIALRFGAELTVPEMAEALGERLTTVEGRVYRALRKLRGQLEG
jgi:RNA polymerase sigma-70 factor, ECF subfamily